MVDNFAFLLLAYLRLYDGSDLKTYLYTRGLAPDAMSLVSPTWVKLLRYSVECTIESLSLLYLLLTCITLAKASCVTLAKAGLVLGPLRPSILLSIRNTFRVPSFVICNSKSFHFFMFKLCLMIVHTLNTCTFYFVHIS